MSSYFIFMVVKVYFVFLWLLLFYINRNVAFKATRMRDSIMEGQDKFIMRKPDNADVGLREDCESLL